MNDATFWIVTRLGLSSALIALGVYDLCRARVPNMVVLPLLFTAIILNVVRLAMGALPLGQMALIATTWVVGLLLWWIRAFGGGDVKLVMALNGLFPDSRLLMTVVLVLLIGHVVMLLGHKGWKRLLKLVALILTSPQGVVSTRAEIQAAFHSRRTPVTWLISLAGGMYLWLVLSWR